MSRRDGDALAVGLQVLLVGVLLLSLLSGVTS